MNFLGLSLTSPSGAVSLSEQIQAYKEATEISAANANRIQRLHDKLTIAANGVEPVFLWVGGSDYNSADNLKTVIGGDLTLQGGNAASPTINAKSLRTTRSSKFLRGANPTLGDTKWTWAVWADAKDEANDHSLVILRNNGSTERGPGLVLSPTSPNTTLSSSVAGTGSNQNIQPVNAGPRTLFGPAFHGFRYDPADTGATWQAFLNGATWESRDATVYNSHAFVRIGGFDDTASTSFPWLTSNAEFYCVAAWDTDLTEAQLAAARIALYNAGVQSRHTSVPAMIYLGDSTTGSVWNIQMHAGAQGGAWRNRCAMGAPIGVSPGDMGGKAFNWHFSLKNTIIQTLNSLPYQQRYFIYTADSPAGMGPGGTFQDFWDEIGVPVGDADGFYSVMEDWLLEIKGATGCRIALCSYIQGTTAGAGEDDRNRVATMAAANSFDFVDLWNEPHSKVATTAAGFYADTIHPTTNGAIVLAEFVTSTLAHPNATDAPRFNVSAPPTITGTPTSGQVLTAAVGTPHVAGTSYTYQWLRNLATIGGATASTYALQAPDVGNRVSCRVTAAKSGQPSASFTAGPTVVVT